MANLFFAVRPVTRPAIATDRLLRIVAIANFAAFVIGTFWLGGDALNGAVRGGHYFLGMHRHFRQVSHATWLYSLLHEISVFVLVLLAFAARLDAREQERRRD